MGKMITTNITMDYKPDTTNECLVFNGVDILGYVMRTSLEEAKTFKFEKLKDISHFFFNDPEAAWINSHISIHPIDNGCVLNYNPKSPLAFKIVDKMYELLGEDMVKDYQEEEASGINSLFGNLVGISIHRAKETYLKDYLGSYKK